MNIGIAADHGGFEMKEVVKDFLLNAGYEVMDFGAHEKNSLDDYPDFIIPLARAVSLKEIDRGIAICGSGVGANIVANKIRGVRAALITDPFSARQGVEDDDMNLICLGGRVIGESLCKELITIFLESTFSGQERHMRRLAKVSQLEHATSL